MATVAAPAGASRPERADATAWIAVAAGALGALLATLDISIVNSALPTIQGEIGATGTEGTWIATSFLVAEIVVIPLSAWLERLLGLRTLLLIAVTAFTGFSVLCGIATDLTTMIIGRTGQGLMGGLLIPTAMTIVAKRLPPQNATGNFTKIVQRVPVRIAIDARPEVRRLLVPGMSVEVTVDTRAAKGELDRLRQAASGER